MSEIKLFSLHKVSNTKMTEWAIPVHVSPINDTAQEDSEQCAPHRHLRPSHCVTKHRTQQAILSSRNTQWKPQRRQKSTALCRKQLGCEQVQHVACL